MHSRSQFEAPVNSSPGGRLTTTATIPRSSVTLAPSVNTHPNQKHKRTFSDIPDPSGSANEEPPLFGEKFENRRQRSFSQTFAVEKEYAKSTLKTVGQFSRSKRAVKAREIAEENEEDCSESEEVIRKIIRERARQHSVASLQSSISQVRSCQEAESRKRISVGSNLKRVVRHLVTSPESSGADSTETVVTIKSQTSVTTVVEMFAETEEEECSSEETAIPVEGHKSTPSFFDSDESLSEATVIFDSSIVRPPNHQAIKLALTSVCLPGEVNKPLRDELLSLIDRSSADSNFVILVTGLYRFEALYEHDVSRGVLTKAIGGAAFPARIISAMVNFCFRFDPTLRVFCPLQSRLLFVAMDAVSLRRRF